LLTSTNLRQKPAFAELRPDQCNTLTINISCCLPISDVATEQPEVQRVWLAKCNEVSQLAFQNSSRTYSKHM